MKTIRYLLYAAVAAIFTMGCTEQPYAPGEPDAEDCQKVYFPQTQENIKDHIIEEGEDLELVFEVRRVVDEGECDVEFRLEESEKGIFEASPLFFRDGQTRAEMKISFPKVQLGKKYECTITVDDPRFASIYDSKNTSFTFSVQVVRWTKLTAGTGKAVYRDALFSDLFQEWSGRYSETSVDIYERSDKPGYFRLDNVYSTKYMATLIEGPEDGWEEPDIYKDYEDYVTETSIYIDATDPEKVWIPEQSTGFHHPSYGDIRIGSNAPEVLGNNSSMLYGTLADGIITLPKQGLIAAFGGYIYFINLERKFRIVLPGYTAENYTVDVSTSEMEVTDGKTVVPAKFDLGKDVAEVRYAIFRGNISDADMLSKIENIRNKTVETVTITSSGSYDISGLKATDVYTLVACAYDATGTYREYGYARFGYALPDDPLSTKEGIVLNFDVIVSDRYESQDYDSTNSFEYWINGDGITHAIFNVYSASYFDTNQEILEKTLMSYGTINNSGLNSINNSELYGVVGDMDPDTEYVFVIYAGNQYHSDFFYKRFRTKGTLHELDRIYYYNDLLETQPTDISAYLKDWKAVSIDIFSEEAKGREIRGDEGTSIRITDAEDGESGKDLVTLSGLFPTLKENPDIRMEYKDGMLYSIGKNYLDKVKIKNSEALIPTWRDLEYTYYPSVGALSSDGYYFDEDDAMLVGGFVHEDVIALVDNKTENMYWTLILGGYSKKETDKQTGEVTYSELSNLVGDAHGYLLLVRPDSPLLESFKENGKATVDEQEKKMLIEQLENICKGGNTKPLPQFDLPKNILDSIRTDGSSAPHEPVSFTASARKSGKPKMTVSADNIVKRSR